MEGSDAETGVVDCSVGTIVWVRRRNGSWWPGKILGPEELSASHLMSPRSGTPVKLLGREDASVDWYNLEKSKRVKPFRCGEFDDCIEKAEASQGIPPKKREKYARREDAILHALELEKELLEKKYGKSGSSSNGKSTKLLDGIGKEATTSPELSHGNGKLANSKSSQLSQEPDVSLEDKSKGLLLEPLNFKEGNQLSGDDENPDVQPRMRGLQDFGLRSAPSKRKLSSLVTSNGSHNHRLDDGVHASLDGPVPTEKNIHVYRKNMLDRKKRSHEAQMEDSLNKRRDKRRPLVQVLESSAKLPVVHSSHMQCDSDIVSSLAPGEHQTRDVVPAKSGQNENIAVKSSESFEYKELLIDQVEVSSSKVEDSNRTYTTGQSEDPTSRSTEDTETDSSETDSMGSDSDVMTTLSDEAAPIKLMRKSLGRSVAHDGQGSMSNEEADYLDKDDISHPCLNEPVSTSVTVSKWQLKGKRNNRNSTKRYSNVSDGKVSKGFTHGMSLKGEESYGCDDADLVEKSIRNQMVGYGSKVLEKSLDINDWEDLSWSDRPATKGCWEDSFEYCDSVYVGRQFGGRLNSMLVDVDLKVQSSYQREHVPMISLMSKLNGKAIIGHPIPIETLENGSSEILLAAADEFHPGTFDYDTALQPVWRTARRTANCRVPRPRHLPSTLDADDTADHLQYVDQSRKLFGKSNAGSLGHKSSMPRKGSSTDRRLFRKPPKKVSASSNQKIRTLSSIGTQQKHNSDLKPHSSNSFQVDGLIKPESLPTAVACIPVKLVFSRLHEELVARHQ